nr:hypothetical protein MACL_00000478 [Theileria orientalis]
MGRKSRKSLLIKPFCYFCGREFDNEKVLVQHQKAKHFKCTECNRKLETANGLSVHMQQVHKMALRRVPNSLEGRDNISSSIQGMNGVPSEVIEEHRAQHMQKLATLKSQKQQRISWTQINAPGFNNQLVTMQNNTGLQTSVPPNMASGMDGVGAMAGTSPDGNMASNFGSVLNGVGVTAGACVGLGVGPNVGAGAVAGAMPGGFMANPLAANMTNGMGVSPGASNFPGALSGGMATGMTPAAPDADGRNKLLILDANGMPVSQPTQASQPAAHQPSKQSLQQSSKILYKGNFSGPATSPTTHSNLNRDTPYSGSARSGGFDRPSSGFDRPSSGHDKSSSGFDRPKSGFNSHGSGFDKRPSGFSTGPGPLSGGDSGFSGASANHADSKAPEAEDDSHTTFYKATGPQPLYVPTPALENTKLSYTSDTVSIEELRAKIKYNWHETQT